MSKIPGFSPFWVPKIMKSEVKKWIKIDAKFGTEKDRKQMKNEEVENMKISAEHHTVVKKQGSRGSVAERTLHRKMMKIRWKNHPKIDEKSIQNRYSKK